MADPVKDINGVTFDADIHALTKTGKIKKRGGAFVLKGESNGTSGGADSENKNGPLFKDEAGNACYRDEVDGTIRLA